jgi:hypothetical protein
MADTRSSPWPQAIAVLRFHPQDVEKNPKNPFDPGGNFFFVR